MRNIAIVLVLAAAAFFAWKKFQTDKQAEAAPAAVTTPDKTPGANAENRVNGLSGAAPAE